MNIGSIALLSVRLLSLLLITTAISEAGSTSSLVFVKSEEWNSFEFLVLFQVMLPMLIGVGMFRYAPKISKWLVKDIEDKENAETVESSRLQISVLTIIGIVIISFGIPELIMNIYANYFAEPFVFNGQEMGKDPNALGRIISILAKLCIGYFLTFYSPQFVRYIDKKRQTDI